LLMCSVFASFLPFFLLSFSGQPEAEHCNSKWVVRAETAERSQPGCVKLSVCVLLCSSPLRLASRSHHLLHPFFNPSTASQMLRAVIQLRSLLPIASSTFLKRPSCFLHPSSSRPFTSSPPSSSPPRSPRMGVEKQTQREGNGTKPKKGQRITVNCTGYLADGMRKFWSTEDPSAPPPPHITPRTPNTPHTHTACCLLTCHGIWYCCWVISDQQPFAFQVGLGQVIRGWDEGFIQMSQGEKARLTMTGDYACQHQHQRHTAHSAG
jgi:peptidylprolyl isomerase